MTASRRQLHRACGAPAPTLLEGDILAGNAGALTGRDMHKYLADAGRDVEMLHLPHYPLQLNPIEIELR